MAGDMTKADYDRLDAEYMEGKARPLDQQGSVLLTNSKFLNSARLRDLYAQEGLRRNGRDVPPTFFIHQTTQALAEVTDEAECEALVARDKARLPDFAAWLDARALTDLTLDELAGFPPGSFGAKVHAYFASQPGFEMNFINRGLQPDTDFKYLKKQRLLAHDLEHMVTGFGPNAVGEYALIACNLKSYYRDFSPDLVNRMILMSGFLLSTGLMKTHLHYPAVMDEMMNGIRRGMDMGDALKRPLFMTDWRSHFGNTIAEMREDLGITDAPPDGHWDWTNAAWEG